MRSIAARTRRRFLAEGAAFAAAAATPLPVLAEASAGEVAPAASDAFVADVVREVAAEARGNVAVSPISLQAALALAALGARGATRERLQSVLGLADLDPAAVHAQFATPLLQASRAAFVRHAAIEPAYARAIAAALSADVRKLPDGGAEAARTINAWVDAATAHRIPALFDEVPEGLPLVLADAVHLKFRWRHIFDPAATRPRPFHRDAGEPVSVPTMSKTLATATGECRAGTFVRLPFEGVEGGVDLVLPREGSSAQEALDIVLRAPQQLDAGAHRFVDLSVPRFELHAGGSMGHAVARAGLAPLFARADLSGISPSLAGSAIGEIAQKVWLKFDETGVEAAAATGVIVTAASISRVEPLVLVFDRPFALLIRDRRTLFAAIVRDPSAS